MSSVDQSGDSAVPSATDEPRWQVSLVELFSAITLLAVLLGLTHWLSRGFAASRIFQTSLRVVLASGATLLFCTLSYWYARWRGGRLLYWLRLRTTVVRWGMLMWIPLVAGLAVYISQVLMGDRRGAASTTLILMWVFGTISVVNLLFGSLRLQENGIVHPLAFAWSLSPWPQCRQLQFQFDEHGDLVAGSSWSGVVARVPPGQQKIVAAILNRKMGLDGTPPAGDGDRRPVDGATNEAPDDKNAG